MDGIFAYIGWLCAINVAFALLMGWTKRWLHARRIGRLLSGVTFVMALLSISVVVGGSGRKDLWAVALAAVVPAAIWFAVHVAAGVSYSRAKSRPSPPTNVQVLVTALLVALVIVATGTIVWQRSPGDRWSQVLGALVVAVGLAMVATSVLALRRRQRPM
jgi:hypothetical protein